MATTLKRLLSTVTLCLMLSSLTLTGCTNKYDPTMDGEMLPEMESVSSLVGNYEDIELPAELELNASKSMAIRTDSFKGGILHFSGRIEINSLKEFIITSMENKKWKLAGEAQYKNVLLAFTKPSRTCMVVLSEGIGGSLGSTNVTLYVTVDVAAAGRVNPFGEPVSQ